MSSRSETSAEDTEVRDTNPNVVRDTNPNVVGCITCPKRAHKANMVNVYDGEYQCQECRWGL